NHIGFNLQVIINKLGSIGVVGQNAAHPGGGEKHIIGALLLEKIKYSSLIAQVQLGRTTQHKMLVASFLQPAQYSATYHAPVTGYVNFIRKTHEIFVESTKDEALKNSGYHFPPFPGSCLPADNAAASPAD